MPCVSRGGFYFSVHWTKQLNTSIAVLVQEHWVVAFGAAYGEDPAGTVSLIGKKTIQSE